MNLKRIRSLKIRYVTSLTRILRTICDAGDHSEEHAEAIRQVEWGLLNCLHQIGEKGSNSETRQNLPAHKLSEATPESTFKLPESDS